LLYTPFSRYSCSFRSEYREIFVIQAKLLIKAVSQVNPRYAGGINMIVGKVTGSIVSTRKSEKLVGNKLMIVEPLESMKSHADRLVAIDNIGAGIGEYVLVAQGSAARIGCDMQDAPVDAAIVGIIDDASRLV
jgi:ethanolamine utilization protein EutN